ncbi:MAG: helix-turn-helix transcriptional regulator [Rhodanobacteraceae bacterium]|uniref:Helix-turn-helix protein n=1 Tax=Tahibacter aquaticus TaxID=520092 RepID=A0A4R6YMH7_9GAMM|nr:MULTISPECIES: helix-turn-helix transcriptional regulator [Tahibacter]MBL8298487.1 helix-turn-helix transcriptional regulator [Rhodanobacteraceae bacterium]TDR38617.1 helix-turn-helix protein [Tahibacter aquaticus]
MPKSIHRAEYRRIIDTLRDHREAQGLTQTGLATLLGRSQQWVSLLERGDRRLDVVEYVELCAALDLDPHVLLDMLIAKLKARGALATGAGGIQSQRRRTSRR